VCAVDYSAAAAAATAADAESKDDDDVGCKKTQTTKSAVASSFDRRAADVH